MYLRKKTLPVHPHLKRQKRQVLMTVICCVTHTHKWSGFRRKNGLGDFEHLYNGVLKKIGKSAH